MAKKLALNERIGHVRGGWNAVPVEVGKSPAFAALSYSAKALLFIFYMRLTSNNNGNLSAAHSQLKHFGWGARGTLVNALKELQAVGFIAVTRPSIGVHQGSKLCQLYRLTDRDSYTFTIDGFTIDAKKASRDYAKITSLKEAEDKIKTALKK